MAPSHSPAQTEPAAVQSYIPSAHCCRRWRSAGCVSTDNSRWLHPGPEPGQEGEADVKLLIASDSDRRWVLVCSVLPALTWPRHSVEPRVRSPCSPTQRQQRTVMIQESRTHTMDGGPRKSRGRRRADVHQGACMRSHSVCQLAREPQDHDHGIRLAGQARYCGR